MLQAPEVCPWFKLALLKDLSRPVYFVDPSNFVHFVRLKTKLFKIGAYIWLVCLSICEKTLEHVDYRFISGTYV
jgi:hypothetical protein